MPRGRGLLTSGVTAVLVVGLGGFALADATQSETGAQARSTLSIIAPAAAGGGWDLAAREFQQATRVDSIVNSTQVINIPGAGGTIALGQLAGHLRDDPSTLMVTGAAMVGGIEMSNSPIRLGDVTPIARLTEDYAVIAVPAHSPWDTFEDFVAALQADPDMPIGGGSAGSPDHLVAGQLYQAVGMDPAELHYAPHAGGGDLTISLLSEASGTVEVGISSFNDFRDLIEGGRLKALAVVAPERLEGVDVPTTGELGYPEVDLINWRGIIAPPDISDEDRDELVEITREMYDTESWAEAVERNRWEANWAEGAEFDEFIAEDEKRIRALMLDLEIINE